MKALLIYDLCGQEPLRYYTLTDSSDIALAKASHNRYFNGDEATTEMDKLSDRLDSLPHVDDSLKLNLSDFSAIYVLGLIP